MFVALLNLCFRPSPHPSPALTLIPSPGRRGRRAVARLHAHLFTLGEGERVKISFIEWR